MSQNTSHAVMSQRVEPHDSLDDFPTPPWATRALIDMLKRRGCLHDQRMTCWEPAANRGHMVKPLREFFSHVRASDVHDYGAGFEIQDFLFYPQVEWVDWIVTNPPFRLAANFIRQARTMATSGVAMLVRTAFLESADRYTELFEHHRPNYVFQFCERVPMVKGRYDHKASTATSYCWLVWLQRSAPLGGTILDWIPPCRKHLERPADYGAAQ